MKIPVKFLIGVLAIIIGISVALVCVLSQHSSHEAVIADYISAINDGDLEAMMEYAPSYFNVFGYGYEDSSEETDPIKAALGKSCFSIPADAEKVNYVEFLGCELVNNDVPEEYRETTGNVIAILIKIEYVDADEETQTIIREKTVMVFEQNGNYIIMPNN
ncbi:MAG: hypothetical protein IKT42_00215 [Clostridia bacterium]|nr:hypothetical protein [Clostridia bacterium]